MLQYEHSRTTDIVNRLVALGNTIRTLTILTWVVVFGIIASVAASFIQPGIWWVGAIIGIGFGYVLGISLSAATNLVIEWMAQVLVAQGEIVEATRKNG